jgi:tetratricopeptide (TPR) repeat protein
VGGNRKAFEGAMQGAANCAWERDWAGAAEAYQRALSEFPKDVNALSGMGLALSGIGEWEAALEAYRQASELSPDDPVLLERMGQVREQLGRGQEAALSYVASAQCYLESQQATDLAVKRWQDAIAAWPECPDAHACLLTHYQEQGQTNKAVGECLALSRLYESRGQHGDAVLACEYALLIDPHHPDVHVRMAGLQREDKEATESEATEGEPIPAIAELVGPARQVAQATAGGTGGEGRRDSPVGLTHAQALASLAESLFDEESTPNGGNGGASKAEMDALIGRAIDRDTRGRAEEAIEAYQSAIQAGAEHPALHFNLGLLYQEGLRFDEAIAEYRSAIGDPEYELGARFGLGECLRARGRLEESLEHFIEALRIIDLGTASDERAAELDQLYNRLATSLLSSADRDAALEFTNSLVTFLSVNGWQQKACQARSRLEELTHDGPALSIAEMLAISDSELVLESLSRAQEYSKQQLFYAGLEECHFALGRSPACLPIHRQIAEIKVQMGKLDQAVDSLVAIGDSYRIRGDLRQAAAMYERALGLTPMNTRVRSRVIELLKAAGDTDGALRHYIGLADAHYQQARMDEARDAYEEALNLTRRTSAGTDWEVRILHKMGDIDTQRVDWKKAVDVYRQIRRIAPQDDKACLALIDLCYRLNRPELAVTEVDSLIKMAQEAGKMEDVFSTLERFLEQRPTDIALRTRTAQAYLDSGKKDQALEHLDRLGDLQLEAGRYEDAKATIRAIVMLKPPNVESYQQLLAQLEENGSG